VAKSGVIMTNPAPNPPPLAEAPLPAEGYAGDISPQLACQWWQAGDAVLVDVRSDAEIAWVGFVPGAVHVPWKLWPGMAINPGFDAALQAAVPSGKKVVMLCRSGIRSIGSSRRATELGYEAYNILEGFEGDPDDAGHRGVREGWRVRGLPWRQN
jgi:rhodanese-related sulfurtransferase